jgi:hypothetical protein
VTETPQAAIYGLRTSSGSLAMFAAVRRASRIIGYKLICERHTLLVELELVSTNVVKVTSSVERIIRNKSAYPQSVKNYTHIDEWGYEAGRSEILECISELEGKTFAANAPVTHAYSLEANTEEQLLKPDQTALLRARYVE